jgi:hypothetical protein
VNRCRRQNELVPPLVTARERTRANQTQNEPRLKSLVFGMDHSVSQCYGRYPATLHSRYLAVP